MATSPLEALALELMLMVLESITDLPTLYNLVCASPSAKLWFDKNAIKITNKLVDNTIPEEFHDYVRWISITGSISSTSSPFAASNIDRFLSQYNAIVSTENQFDNTAVLHPGLIYTPGPRKVLLAATRVQRLEDACLHHMLSRLHELAPGHPDGPMGATGVDHLIRLPQESFKPFAAWAPSWVERFRVQEGLWQILDGASSSAIPGMPSQGIHRVNRGAWSRVLQPDHAEALVGDVQRGYQRGDGYDSVDDTLRELLGCHLTSMLAGLVTEPVRNQALNNLSAACASVPADYYDEQQPVEGEEGDMDGQSRRHATMHNYATSFYVTRYRWLPTSGPLNRQGLRALSLLGVSIWDTRRLVALGLALPPGTAPMPFGPCAYLEQFDSIAGRQLAAWRSVFLQELRRLRGTWLGLRAILGDCDAYVDAWGTETAPLEWTPIVRRMTEFRPSMGEARYDGPLESGGSRNFHNGVVRDMIEEMRFVMTEYQQPVEEVEAVDAVEGVQDVEGGLDDIVILAHL